MAWLRVDDCFNDHPKVEALAKDPRTQGDALAVWITMAVDCAHRQTDGEFSPERLQKCFPGWTARRRESALAALVKVGLVDAREDGANVMRSWLEYNPSRASLLERASGDRARRDKGRDNRWRNATFAEPQNHRTPHRGVAAAGGPVPVPVPVFSSKEEKGASAPRSPSEKASEWLTSWRAHFKVSDEISNTPTRIRCVEAALKRHGLEKCLDAIRGYAADPWRHEQLSRHDVSVILGSGGTTKEDKVIYGLELLSQSQPPQSNKTPEPETEVEVARAVLEWLDAGEGELVCPLKYVDHESRQWPVARPFDIVARKIFNDWLLLSTSERLARVATIRADFSAKLSGVTC